MPRPKPFPYLTTALHAEAARTEKRLARALFKAIREFRGTIAINDLAMAIHAKDIKRAMSLVGSQRALRDHLRGHLIPARQIIKEAFVRGGKIAAKDLVAKISARLVKNIEKIR